MTKTLSDVAAFVCDRWPEDKDSELHMAVQRAILMEEAGAELRRLLIEALEETEEVLRLCEHTPFADPAYHDAVKSLGRRIGFGALMSTAERAWREVAEERGDPVGGEFVRGPCRSTVDSLLSQVRGTLNKAERQDR